MKFMLNFALKPDTRDAAIARFKATGGVPPSGARLLARWTKSDLTGGFVVVESDDPKALTEYALMWTDLIELTLVPVVEDAPLARSLYAAVEIDETIPPKHYEAVAKVIGFIMNAGRRPAARLQ